MISVLGLLSVYLQMNQSHKNDKIPEPKTATNSTSLSNSNIDPKIQKIFQTFNDFILTYHSSEDEEDAHIRRLWESLKKVIQRDPTNLEAHYAFINNIMIKNPSGKGPSKLTVSRRAKLENTSICHLKDISRKMLQNMHKNNQVKFGHKG